MNRSSSTNPVPASALRPARPRRRVRWPGAQASDGEGPSGAPTGGSRRVRGRVASSRPIARSSVSTRVRPTRLERARGRRRLSRRNRRMPRPQVPTVFWVIVATVGLLCLLGLIMVLSHRRSPRRDSTARPSTTSSASPMAGRRTDRHVRGVTDRLPRLARLGPALMTGTVIALLLV